MVILGSATFLMLLAVMSLDAAPAIENAAYVSQDLLADESAPDTWIATADAATAAVKRPRRYDVDGSVHCSRHGKHWPGHGYGHEYGYGYESGYGFGHGFGFGSGPGFGHGHGHGHEHGRGRGRGYGHGHGHGYGSGYGHNFGFGVTGFGNDDNPNEPQYKVPLAPFNENQQGSTELNSSSLAPPTSKTTGTPATTATTTTTTEDATLAIDLRSGLS